MKFKIKQIGMDRYVVTYPDGTRFTTNEFKTEAEADKFLLKLIKNAKELMDTHDQLKGKQLN